MHLCRFVSIFSIRSRELLLNKCVFLQRKKNRKKYSRMQVDHRRSRVHVWVLEARYCCFNSFGDERKETEHDETSETGADWVKPEHFLPVYPLITASFEMTSPAPHGRPHLGIFVFAYFTQRNCAVAAGPRVTAGSAPDRVGSGSCLLQQCSTSAPPFTPPPHFLLLL